MNQPKRYSFTYKAYGTLLDLESSWKFLKKVGKSPKWTVVTSFVVCATSGASVRYGSCSHSVNRAWEDAHHFHTPSGTHHFHTPSWVSIVIRIVTPAITTGVTVPVLIGPEKKLKAWKGFFPATDFKILQEWMDASEYEFNIYFTFYYVWLIVSVTTLILEEKCITANSHHSSSFCQPTPGT